MVFLFLDAKKLKVQSGEMEERTWKEYETYGDRMIRVFGANTLVESLGPADFKRLRADFQKTHRSLASLQGDVRKSKVFFHWAGPGTNGQGYIDRLPRFGDAFRPPNDPQYVSRVFITKFGDPYRPANLSRELGNAMVRAGMGRDQGDFYDLRRTGTLKVKVTDVGNRKAEMRIACLAILALASGALVTPSKARQASRPAAWASMPIMRSPATIPSTRWSSSAAATTAKDTAARTCGSSTPRARSRSSGYPPTPAGESMIFPVLFSTSETTRRSTVSRFGRVAPALARTLEGASAAGHFLTVETPKGRVARSVCDATPSFPQPRQDFPAEFLVQAANRDRQSSGTTTGCD